MGNFVKTTSLWRTANLANRNQITPVFVATLPGLIQDLTQAMNAWAAQGGSPPADTTLYGAFELRWAQADLRAYIVCGTPMVTVVDDLVVIDTDIWETKAQHDGAPNAPLIRETFVHQNAQTLADVQKTVFDYLVTATVQPAVFTGDLREPRANVTTDSAFDTQHNWLTKPFVIGLEGRVFNLV